MQVQRAIWAATGPWSGLQDKPTWLDNPDGIPWSAILNPPDEDNPAGLATVAFTGRYSDLIGRPNFGTAAFQDSVNFATAAQGTRADSALQEDLTGRTITGGLLTEIEELSVGVQALSGAGAVSLTEPATDFTSTGVADALTLADGSLGQIKTVTHVVDGGSGVLTPATPLGYATITFNDAGDSVTLRFTSAGWAIIGSRGVVIA